MAAGIFKKVNYHGQPFKNWLSFLVKSPPWHACLHLFNKKHFSWSFIRREKIRQKFCQKFSVIKTNTSDDIKKMVHFGILIHVLS